MERRRLQHPTFKMGFISFDAPVGADDRLVGREPPPGRDVAEQLLRSAEAAGAGVVEPLSQHDSYGWCFTVQMSAQPAVWCMLQLSDEWLVITRANQPLLRRLFGGTAADHATIDAALVSAVTSLPHVSNVRWFRNAEDLRHGRAGQP